MSDVRKDKYGRELYPWEVGPKAPVTDQAVAEPAVAEAPEVSELALADAGPVDLGVAVEHPADGSLSPQVSNEAPPEKVKKPRF